MCINKLLVFTSSNDVYVSFPASYSCKSDMTARRFDFHYSCCVVKLGVKCLYGCIFAKGTAYGCFSRAVFHVKIFVVRCYVRQFLYDTNLSDVSYIMIYTVFY